MEQLRNKIVHGDCLKVLGKVSEPFADLVFADPPFNIGYKYDKYHDKVERDAYLEWTRGWISACRDILKAEGSFYIAIGDKYAAEIKIAAEELGLTLRNWIVWHYSFGQQMRTKFALSHTHIFYFVKDARRFTFNDDTVRVISDRQKKYRDKRANPAGKMPDDVWDEYPRICGTFEERTGFPCQMPESLLARIIRLSSNQGDWVVDPFSGSGTTAVVAHKLGRIYTSVDMSKDYADGARKRIAESEGLPVEGEGQDRWSEHVDAELKWLYHENKVSQEQLGSNAMLGELFVGKFNERLGQTDGFSHEDVVDRLETLRKSGKLGPLRGETVRM